MDVNSKRGKTLTTAERRQLDKDGHADRITTQLTDDIERRGDRPSGSEQVVDQQDPRTRSHRVAVDFQCVRGILELVLARHLVCRELAEFADRDEPCAELIGDRSAKNKSPRLHRHDDVYAGPVERGRQ